MKVKSFGATEHRLNVAAASATTATFDGNSIGNAISGAASALPARRVFLGHHAGTL